MSTIKTEVSGVIAASPEEIYAVLSDYDEGHHAILPERYFTELKVERGGQGDGTVFVVQMDVMGARRTYRMTVSEPVPGRVLKESDQEAGVETTFTLNPLEGAQKTRVTIATEARASAGLAGLLERWFNPGITRRIYREELQLLEAYLEAKRG